MVDIYDVQRWAGGLPPTRVPELGTVNVQRLSLGCADLSLVFLPYGPGQGTEPASLAPHP